MSYRLEDLDRTAARPSNGNPMGAGEMILWALVALSFLGVLVLITLHSFY